MASKRGAAILIEQAETRMKHLLPSLAGFLEIDIAPMPTNSRDPIQQTVVQTEWLVDTLEAIDRVVVPLADAVALKAEIDRLTAENEALTAELEAMKAETPESDEISDGVTALDVGFDQEEYRELKLDQLKAIAVLAGAADEDVAKLRAKADVLEVIETRVVAEDFEPVMFTIGDDGEIERFDPPEDPETETAAGESSPVPDTDDITGEDA